VFEQVFDHPTPVGATSTPALTGSGPGVDERSWGEQMRRYDDPVETRMGQVAGTEGPEQFLWRGRLWKVRAVLAHWVETGPWWQSGGARAVIGSDDASGPSPDDRRSSPDDRRSSPDDRRSSPDDRRSSPSRPPVDLLGERELWRVEAGRGPGGGGPAPGAGDADGATDGGGVFDLAFDWSNGRWALVGCTD
jgi:hypothetical protein